MARLCLWTTSIMNTLLQSLFMKKIVNLEKVQFQFSMKLTH